jgi:hypothetical protein
MMGLRLFALAALSDSTLIQKTIESIHSEWENENWIIFTDYITCMSALQKLQWVFGKKEKVVENKYNTKKESWKELNKYTLNPFSPLDILMLDVRDSHMLDTQSKLEPCLQSPKSIIHICYYM